MSKRLKYLRKWKSWGQPVRPDKVVSSDDNGNVVEKYTGSCKNNLILQDMRYRVYNAGFVGICREHTLEETKKQLEAVAAEYALLELTERGANDES